MPEAGKCVIHWLRRDLRIADNPALYHAHSHGLPVVPVYILSGWTGNHDWTGSGRQHFLSGCLASLAEDLSSIGGRLVLRRGDPIKELEILAKETGAIAIHVNKSPDPHGKATEEALRRRCAELGIQLHLHDDVGLQTPGAVLTRSGDAYKVFTPYFRNWITQAVPAVFPKPGRLNTPAHPVSIPLPDVSLWGLPSPPQNLAAPGEAAAHQRMGRALGEILRDYEGQRDFPSTRATSRLSQDLRFGLLSVRTLVAGAMELRSNVDPRHRSGIDAFIRQLAWRDFYFAILHHFPHVLDLEFNPDWRGLWWAEPGEHFEAWQEGRTGFPIVDAGIRELLSTGLMHNRVRMITAMFLTKDLHIDWRLGESFFMRHLVDGEISANNGGWQWSAGTGADAAPYFRIQNPWSQSLRYDADGTYIRRWVPELEAVPAKQLHTPPLDGRSVAPGYPAPIVDHKTERERTLEIFKRHRAKMR